MLSNTCKYAIRAIIYMAINGGEERRIGIKKIAEELDIPTPFLGKILQNLVRHKLLVSTKGPHGGFGLAKPAADITLLDIIEIIDGMDLFNNCLIGLSTCSATSTKELQCPIHSKYLPISQQLYKLFSETNIRDLGDDIDASGGTIGL